MSDVGSITTAMSMLDEDIKNYVFNGYAALSSSVSIYLRTALICYVAFMGWSTTQSWSPITGGQAIKRAITLSVVLMLVTNWDFFSLMIYNVATNAPNALSGVLVGATGHDPVSANEALQATFDRGIQDANKIWQNGSWRAPEYYLAALIVLIFDYLSSGFALFEMSVAKCGLGVTVVLAPVFAPCLLWESGKSIFAAWLKTVWGFALVPLILMSVIMLMNPILERGLDAIEASNLETGWGCFSTFVLGSFACAGLLLKSAMIANNIAGGITISAMDAMPAARLGMGMASGAWKAVKAPYQGARWAINKAKGK